MSVVMVGADQGRLPLELFERLAIDEESKATVLSSVLALPGVSEAVVLSTCLRTEIYVVVEMFHDSVTKLVELMASRGSIDPSYLGAYLTLKHADDAAMHLFEVAAGLKSAVIGETEVLGQVRQAFRTAEYHGAVGPLLSDLFRRAIGVGKRVRTETAIAKGTTSMSQAAVDLILQQGGSLRNKLVAIVGAGETAEGVLDALRVRIKGEDEPSDMPTVNLVGRWKGAGDDDEEALLVTTGETGGMVQPNGRSRIVVVNRSIDKAKVLADRVSGDTHALDNLPWVMSQADVVVACVATTKPIVDTTLVKQAVKSRWSRPLLIVDMGVPRNIAPEVGEMSGVSLITLDQVAEFVGANLDDRYAELDRARTMIQEELERYRRDSLARTVVPIVTAFRERVERIRQEELNSYRHRLAGLSDQEWSAVEALTKRITNKLMHEPTVRIKEAALSTHGNLLAEALKELFGL